MYKLFTPAKGVIIFLGESMGIESFKKLSRKKLMIILAMAAIMIVASIVTLKLNLKYISYGELIYVLLHRKDPSVNIVDRILVWDLRVPRMLSCILAGFALGIAGAVMQCVLRNPLGSPYTLGISNASAFGAAMGIIVLGGGTILGQSTVNMTISNPYIVTVSAFLWAIIATGIIVLLVKITKVSPEAMVLAGVALSSIFSAGISLLQYMYNEYALSTIVFWQFGSMGKAGWDDLRFISVVALFSISFFLYNRIDYNALDSGDEVAASLGVNVERLRILSLTVAALVTASVVAFMGIVAFVGLLGPHIVRRFVGNDHRYLLLGSMFLGAIILLISDCIGQVAFDFTIPVGIITSFLGGPLFLYLLIMSYRKRSNLVSKLMKSRSGE